MNQNDVKRQAIQEQRRIKAEKESQQHEILTGIIDNESKTYTFEKTLTLIGGQKKSGTFKVKYLGVTARLRIGTIRAKLLDGAPSQSLDNLTDDIAYIIAYLTVAIVEKPSWFDFDALDEYSELKEMYLEVYEFIQSFRYNDGENTNAGHSSDTSSTEDVEIK